VPFPVGEDRIEEAEAQLRRPLPAALRHRLMRDNGGKIVVAGYPGDDPIWSLHPVWDPSDRRRMARTANHIVSETRAAHKGIAHLPAGSIVIAHNGSGDLLLIPVDRDDPVWWNHETGEVEPATVDWS
jgi:SMI1 / KNR4 family (SUKH-1)